MTSPESIPPSSCEGHLGCFQFRDVMRLLCAPFSGRVFISQANTEAQASCVTGQGTLEPGCSGSSVHARLFQVHTHWSSGSGHGVKREAPEADDRRLRRPVVYVGSVAPCTVGFAVTFPSWFSL